MTEDEFYQNIQEQAEAYVKDEMVKYAIARAENITLTDEEYRLSLIHIYVYKRQVSTSLPLAVTKLKSRSPKSKFFNTTTNQGRYFFRYLPFCYVLD